MRVLRFCTKPVVVLYSHWLSNMRGFIPAARLWLMWMSFFGLFTSYELFFNEDVRELPYYQTFGGPGVWATPLLAASVLSSAAILKLSARLLRLATVLFTPFHVYMSATLFDAWVQGEGGVSLAWWVWLFPAAVGITILTVKSVYYTDWRIRQ